MFSENNVSIPPSALEMHLSSVSLDHTVRYLRMQVVNEDGTPNQAQIEALCRPLCASLYYDLMEAMEDLPDHYEIFITLLMNDKDTAMYLYICFLYKLVGRVIPEEIQWMAANNAVLYDFCEAFSCLFHEFLTEDGFFDNYDDENDPDNVYFIPQSFGRTIVED